MQAAGRPRRRPTASSASAARSYLRRSPAPASTAVRPAAFPAATATRCRSLFDASYPRWTVAAELQLPARRQLAGGVRRARARAAEPGAGADEADRAAGRDRRHQRRGHRAERRRARRRRRRRRASSRRRQLEAEQSKFEVGMSTNYNVIQAQRDLATAQNNELQAILELPQVARRARAAAADDAAEPEHHAAAARRGTAPAQRSRQSARRMLRRP